MDKEVFFERFHRNERVIMLSDGVFAIVLTLLVLELRLPKLPEVVSNAILWDALFSIKSKFISFFLSFFFIAIRWFNHNQMFKLFIKVDNTMLWLNNGLLFLICFLPFPTVVMGDYPNNSAGVFMFGIISVLVPLLYYTIIKRARKKNYVHAGISVQLLKKLNTIVFILCPVSIIPLTFAAWMPKTAVLCYILISLWAAVTGSKVKVIKDADEPGSR